LGENRAMRTYKKLDSPDERYLINLKKRLIHEQGSVCAGCLKKVWAPELDVYVIDDEKAQDDRNLILLDKACRASIAMILTMLNDPDGNRQREWYKWVYGGDRNPMKDRKRPKSSCQTGRCTIANPYDYRAGEGELILRT